MRCKDSKFENICCFSADDMKPGIVCSIMNILHSTCVYNFLPSYWGTFNSTNQKTELSHGTMILCTSIKTHPCILQLKKKWLSSLIILEGPIYDLFSSFSVIDHKCLLVLAYVGTGDHQYQQKIHLAFFHLAMFHLKKHPEEI